MPPKPRQYVNRRALQKSNVSGETSKRTGESTKAATTEVQTITSRKGKKPNAQRCREYRERKKLQNTMVQNITAGRSDECSEADQLPAKKPKTNAERRKKHYEAHKQKIKKIPKTDKQRSKECYDRKKKIQALNALNHHSDANLPDLDSDATMKVCRVCLTMNVKMYGILGHNLNVMYERVSGLQVKAVDKLPKMLCCQCVASLTSANNFIEKTLKTHQLLVAKIPSSKAFVTIRDVKSIDKAQYQLESLGFKISKEKDSSFCTTNESDTSSDHRKSEYYNYFEASGADFCEDNNIAVKSEKVQNFNAEFNMHVEVPIKSEYIEPSEEQNEPDENNKTTDISGEKVEIKIQALDIVKQEYIEPSEEQNEAEESNEATNMSGEKVETTFPELVMVKQEYIGEEEQATDDFKNFRIPHTDQSSNDNEIVCTPLIKMETDFVVSGPFCTDTIEEEKYTHFKEEINVCEDMNMCDPENTSDIASESGLETHSSEDLFTCDVCQKQFKVKNILIQHIKIHSKSTLFSCANCKYETYNKRYLKAHITSMHPKEGVFTCKYCRYKTYVKSSLNRHLKRKHINLLFNCEYCSHVTNSKMLLKEHVNAKHTKKNVYYCTDCHYKTYKKGSLDSHIKIKHSKKLVYNCPQCCFKTYNKGYIKYHVDAQHIKAASFQCSFCSYSSHVKRNYIRHVNSRHNRQVCPYTMSIIK